MTIFGKVKTVTDVDTDEVIIHFEDKVTAGNGRRVDFPEDKGSVCCKISSILFQKLEQCGIPTHYIDMPKDNDLLCKKVDIIPVEVIVRNIAAGSLCRQTYIEEGTYLYPPLVEFYLKDDEKDDPFLSLERMDKMGYTEVLSSELSRQGLKVNEILLRIFDGMGMDLVDFKLEFGYDSNGNILLADELSPDNMRLWKKGTKEKFDKDLFRKDEGNIVEAYKHILLKLDDMYKYFVTSRRI